jgi:DNA-binding transcriptional LysR family regulator
MAQPQNIDVALLRAFVAVAETGHMTTAAKVIHRSQGAVSQQIKRLESVFGLRLLDRQADAARLTQHGEKLLVSAQRLISLNDEVLDQMGDADFTGEVRLGVAHDIVRVMLPPVLRRFRQEHPHVLITLVSDTTKTLGAALRERKIDLALVTERERGNRDQFLLSDRLVWVGAMGGGAHRRRPLSVALGQNTCGLKTVAITALTLAGIPWRPICQAGSLEPVFAALEADTAIALFLSRTVPDRLTALSSRDLPPLPPFCINLRLPAIAISPVVTELARHIREEFSSRYG